MYTFLRTKIVSGNPGFWVIEADNEAYYDADIWNGYTCVNKSHCYYLTNLSKIKQQTVPQFSSQSQELVLIEAPIPPFHPPTSTSYRHPTL